jgi:hypothetical protein
MGKMLSKKQASKSLNSAQNDGNAKQVLSNAPLSQEAGLHHAHRQEGVHGAQHVVTKHVHGGK